VLNRYGRCYSCGTATVTHCSYAHASMRSTRMGFPIQIDGASTVIDGLFFVGTHFLRTRRSSTLFGVGQDAAIVARTIAQQMTAA